MTNDGQVAQPLIETIAGFAAGVASTLVAHPLDVLKTRLQGNAPHHTRHNKPFSKINAL